MSDWNSEVPSFFYEVVVRKVVVTKVRLMAASESEATRMALADSPSSSFIGSTDWVEPVSCRRMAGWENV